MIMGKVVKAIRYLEFSSIDFDRTPGGFFGKPWKPDMPYLTLQEFGKVFKKLDYHFQIADSFKIVIPKARYENL
jgi:hypothetical protein